MSMNGTAGLLRTINRAAVIELLRESSPISRSNISKTLNISLPTTMRIIDELIEEKLVCETGLKEQSKGRPAPLIEFNGAGFAIIGVDLGGTKIYGTVADMSGNVQHSLYRTHEENETIVGTDYLEGLCHFIQQLIDAPRPDGQKIRGIGIGAPAITLVPEGIVTWAPSLNWRDLPLQDILTERFDLPVIVDNDVNLAALGEWGFGAGKKASSMVMITLGTGIGAGIIIDGEIYRGRNQAAGEIGYMLPSIHLLGKTYDEFGALEMIASGTGIADRAKILLNQEGISMPDEWLDARYVFAQAELGAKWAEKVLTETIDYLSMAIVNLSTVLDPEMIVLGGGVTNSSQSLIELINKRINGVTPFVPELKLTKLGREAAVMGAIMQVMKATDEYVVIKQLG